MKLRFEHMLVLSTIHLHPDTVDRLCGGDLGYYPNEYGAFIYIDPMQIIGDLPQDLQEMMRFALLHRADWIKVDPDGQVVEGLKVFEREGVL